MSDEERGRLIFDLGLRIQSCDDEIARTNSNKYVPEDEDDEEGRLARIDKPFYERILSALERSPLQEKGISAKASKAAMHVAAQRLLVHTDAISASDLDMVAEDVITAYQLALSGTHP